MSLPTRHIKFHNSDRRLWISQISKEKDICETLTGHNFVIHFDEHIQKKDLEPLHLVTLACLIEHIFSTGNYALLSTDNAEISNYITADLGFQSYWSGGKNHVEAAFSTNIFNLWRIIDTEKDLYASNVESYLRSTYFSQKDLSSVNVCLVEAFYNVFDHAKANGNAFSLLSYDEEKGDLRGAICDFGVGIVQTIIDKYPDVKNDMEAVNLSIKTGITARSTDRNKGFGMGNIIDNVDNIRIMSGHGLFVKTGNDVKTYLTQFPFFGTLIYFDINLASLEDEVVMDSFTL